MSPVSASETSSQRKSLLGRTWSYHVLSTCCNLMRTSWIEAVLPKIDIAASAAGPSPHGHDGLG